MIFGQMRRERRSIRQEESDGIAMINEILLVQTFTALQFLHLLLGKRWIFLVYRFLQILDHYLIVQVFLFQVARHSRNFF